MVDLSALIQAAHGGDAVSSIASQFGISPDQVSAAISALAPAIAQGVQNHMQTPEGLSQIVGHLTDPAHQAAFNDPNAAQAPAAAGAGGDLLGQIFGGAGGIGQIAQHIGAETGISPDILNQLMPVVASMTMGGVAQAAQSGGLGGLLSQVAGAAGQGGGLGGLLSQVAGAAGQGGGGIGGMLGSLASAVGGQGGQGAGQGGGLGGMLSGLVGSLFGGGAAASGAPAAGAAAAPAQGGLDPALMQAGVSALSGLFQSGGASGGLQNVLGQILAKK